MGAASQTRPSSAHPARLPLPFVVSRAAYPPDRVEPHRQHPILQGDPASLLPHSSTQCLPISILPSTNWHVVDGGLLSTCHPIGGLRRPSFGAFDGHQRGVGRWNISESGRLQCGCLGRDPFFRFFALGLVCNCATYASSVMTLVDTVLNLKLRVGFASTGQI